MNKNSSNKKTNSFKDSVKKGRKKMINAFGSEKAANIYISKSKKNVYNSLKDKIK